MLNQIKEAIKNKDYQKAQELLQQLITLETENPWIELYQGLIQEETGKKPQAEQTYRSLLRSCDNYQIISQARQGLERIEREQKKQQPQEPQPQLIPKKPETAIRNLGVLVLEAIDSEKKKTASQELAKIIGIDNYSASLQLPTRSWRLYRTGEMEDLRFLTSLLQKASIPCFATAFKEINAINVYQVNYFQSVQPEVKVYCQDQTDTLGQFSFDWSEVKNRVEGAIPIFENVTEKNSKGKLEIKTKVLDYALFCDLHLPERKTILRIGSPNYQFNEGLSLNNNQNFPKHTPPTLKENWQILSSFLSEKISHVKIWSDFNKFGEMALDFKLMLRHLQPNIKLMRLEPTPWDPAFQLYSGLVFLNYSS